MAALARIEGKARLCRAMAGRERMKERYYKRTIEEEDEKTDSDDLPDLVDLHPKPPTISICLANVFLILEN